jgi:O-antigen biosynthesis protein
MKLSVIIVNYNVRYFLQQCLQSVEKAIAGLKAEVFVVDNNSTDGSNKMVQELFPWVHLIANKDNKGFSKANNQAIRISKGEYVLLLNPDTVVEETTFALTCKFMDEHQDAGGLGVQMIDGKGNFLPESKRGLPTPMVAFWKIFGLSALFPKSKTFGRYHLGYLSKEEVHSIEVLSGAFMQMRRSTLDKTGLLDEDYFMYGEDIDLSYRILKAGYKNYYFPHTRIIHYKGESTKKSSVNYVIVFYKAMVIFARKHFAPGGAAMFSALINMAIWLRAGAAIFKRLLERIWLPLIDAVLLYAGMNVLKNYWEFNMKDVHYPPEFMQLAVPAYILLWLTGAYLGGGYDKPWRLTRLVRGIFSGSLIILVIYALLPETYRFSRALILLGTAWACLALPLVRAGLQLSGSKSFRLADSIRKRFLIAGDGEESQRILSLLMMSGNSSSFVGFVSDEGNKEDQPLAMQSHYLGHTSTLPDLIRLYEVNEVIFCGKNLSSAEIIGQMLKVQDPGVEIKIAPPESLFIIGSHSINENGDFYLIDFSTLNSPVNRRNKRIFDLTTAFFFLLTSPLLIWFTENKTGFLRNIFRVLSGKISWVGIDHAGDPMLRGYRKGVLNPSDLLLNNTREPQIIERLNVLYAKEYKVYNDLRILTRRFKLSGR